MFGTLEKLEFGILLIFYLGNLGPWENWNLGSSYFVILGIWDLGNMGFLETGILGIWNLEYLELEFGTLGIWDLGN